MSLVEYVSPARWFRMVLMAVLAMLAIYVESAPLGLSADAQPSPDLLLCVIAYWAIRRPGSTPMVLVFFLGLMRDLLTDVPVGAGALSLVLIAEALKHWRRSLARSAFLLEWLVVALAALAATVLHWGLVVLTLGQPPYLIELGNQCLYTAAAYPAVALVFRWLFRISWRKPEAVA